MAFPISCTTKGWGLDGDGQGTPLTYSIQLTMTRITTSFCGDVLGTMVAYTRVPAIPGEGFVENIVGEVEVAEVGEGGDREGGMGPKNLFAARERLERNGRWATC